MEVKYINPKIIGFAPASCLFPGSFIFGFGFKLAFIGFCLQIVGEHFRAITPALPCIAGHSNRISTISGLVPTRMGGPQVPAPQDV